MERKRQKMRMRLSYIFQPDEILKIEVDRAETWEMHQPPIVDVKSARVRRCEFLEFVGRQATAL
jgi:hypothetical protein